MFAIASPVSFPLACAVSAGICSRLREDLTMCRVLLCAALLLSSVPSFAQVPAPVAELEVFDAPTCTPPWTSWGDAMAPCVVGAVCSDFEGFRIEALAVNTLTGKIAIRDIDKRYCRGQKPATWVLYSLGKSFKFAECELSASWVQEFAAWPAGCHQQFPVLTVRGGAITITPSGGR